MSVTYVVQNWAKIISQKQKPFQIRKKIS